MRERRNVPLDRLAESSGTFARPGPPERAARSRGRIEWNVARPLPRKVALERGVCRSEGTFERPGVERDHSAGRLGGRGRRPTAAEAAIASSPAPMCEIDI